MPFTVLKSDVGLFYACTLGNRRVVYVFRVKEGDLSCFCLTKYVTTCNVLDCELPCVSKEGFLLTIVCEQNVTLIWYQFVDHDLSSVKVHKVDSVTFNDIGPSQSVTLLPSHNCLLFASANQINVSNVLEKFGGDVNIYHARSAIVAEFGKTMSTLHANSEWVVDATLPLHSHECGVVHVFTTCRSKLMTYYVYC